MVKRIIKVLATTVLLSLLLTACSATKHSRELFAMDTQMTLTAYGPNGEQALEEAAQELQRLDTLLSTGNASSEIAMLNSRGEGSLSADSQAIIEEALRLYTGTGGVFDITVYPLMRLWGFTDGAYRVPTDQERTEALKLIGADQIRLENGVCTLGPGQMIDLGGIAKGYASDRLMEIFRENGVTSAMVSLGGNIQTLNAKPDGSAYRIAIRSPHDTQEYVGYLSVVNQAVVTSGGYERYFEENGNRYHHILDPKTGLPAQSGLASVTIVSSSGMLADGLSTALFIMGLEQAEVYWRSSGEDFEAVFVTDGGDIYITQGLEGRFTGSGDYTVLKR